MVCHSSAGPGGSTWRATTAVDVGVEVAVAEGAKAKATLARVAEQWRNRAPRTKLPTARPMMVSRAVLVVEVVVVKVEESKVDVGARARRGTRALLMAGWLPAGVKVKPERGKVVTTAAKELPKAEAIILAPEVGAGDEMAQAGGLAMTSPHQRGQPLRHQ